MGDMERTQASVTNLLRSLTDQIKELAIQIYEKWRPNLVRALTAIRDFLVLHGDAIAETIGNWTNGLASFVKYITTDFSSAVEIGLKVGLEAFKAFGRALMVIMEDIFTRLFNNIGPWIERALAQKIIFEKYQAQFLKQLGSRGGLLSLYGEKWYQMGGAGAREQEEAIRAQAEKMAREALQRDIDAGIIETAFPNIQTQSQTLQRLKTIWADMRKEIDAIKATMPQLSEAEKEAAQQAVTDLEKVAAKIAQAKDAFIKAGREAAEMGKSLAQQWKDMWLDASNSIAGSMETAFADIVENASNATEAISNMLRQIGRAISQAVFQQYLLPPIFAGIGKLGIPLQVPGARATATQEAPYQPVVHQQYGGFIPKGTDTIPAMLSPGEAVLPERMVDYLRRGLGVEGGSAAATNVNINVSAIDAQGTMQFLSKNKRMIAGMLERTMDSNHSIRRKR